MLAALMATVGLYYENQTGATGTTSLDAMVGTALDPSRPREYPEATVHTLWGEMAYQLGGRAGLRGEVGQQVADGAALVEGRDDDG